jgi:hypothetical protein
MSNSYTQFTMDDALPCSKELADKIIASLELGEKDEDNCDPHGIQAEFSDGEIYLFGEEYANVDNLPDIVLELIGQALKEAGKKYIGFGEGWYGDKARPQSCGGRFGRIYCDGFMEIPETVFSYEPAERKE